MYHPSNWLNLSQMIIAWYHDSPALYLAWVFGIQLTNGSCTSGRATGRANLLSEWCLVFCFALTSWVLEWTLIISTSLCLQLAQINARIHNVKYCSWQSKWTMVVNRKTSAHNATIKVGFRYESNSAQQHLCAFPSAQTFFSNMQEKFPYLV